MERQILDARVATYKEHCRTWGLYNQGMSHGLFIVSLLVSGAATVSGVYGWAHGAAIFGAIGTAVIAYRGYAKNDNLARWYAKALNACESMQAELEKKLDERGLNELSDRLEELRTGDAFWGSDPPSEKSS